MPKMQYVKDANDAVSPLRVTVRKARKLSARCITQPSIRVKCGCCNEVVEIYHTDDRNGDPNLETLEINGVSGTIDQWRQILLPLLGARAIEKELVAYHGKTILRTQPKGQGRTDKTCALTIQ